MNEKPRFKVPYCKYCHEYATVSQPAPVDWVKDGVTAKLQKTKIWGFVCRELVCKDHERNPLP